MAAVILFILATFLILIPAVQDQMLEGKKETTEELTRSAISIINEYYAAGEDRHSPVSRLSRRPRTASS